MDEAGRRFGVDSKHPLLQHRRQLTIRLHTELHFRILGKAHLNGLPVSFYLNLLHL
ncbi:hypothetical protein D3C81_2134020 [compost metagenome]